MGRYGDLLAPQAPAVGRGRYGALLAGSNEEAFRRWYAERARVWGLNPNPDDPLHLYDYRAAFRAGAEPDPASGHWPSEFKADAHPNRYVGILDTKTGLPRTIPGGQLAVTPAEEPGILGSAGRAIDRFATAGYEGLASILEIPMRAGRGYGTLAGGGSLGEAVGEVLVPAEELAGGAGRAAADAAAGYERAKERFAEVPLPPAASAAASTGLDVAGQMVMDPSVVLPGGAAVKYLARRSAAAAAGAALPSPGAVTGAVPPLVKASKKLPDLPLSGSFTYRRTDGVTDAVNLWDGRPQLTPEQTLAFNQRRGLASHALDTPVKFGDIVEDADPADRAALALFRDRELRFDQEDIASLQRLMKKMGRPLTQKELDVAEQGFAAERAGFYKMLEKEKAPPPPPAGSAAALPAQALPAAPGPYGPMSTKAVTNVTSQAGQDLAQLAAENADALQAARGGTKSVSRYHDAELLATSLGMDVDDFLGLPAAKVLSDDELSLGRHLLGGLAEKAVAAAAGGKTDGLAALKLTQVKLMAVLQGKGYSQAGRVLRSGQEALTPFESTPQLKLQAKMLQSFKDKLDPDVLQKIAQLDPSDPEGIIRFLGQMDRPDWKQYRSALWYGSVLSGPKTLLRNTLGNVAKLASDLAMRPLEAAVEIPLAKATGRTPNRTIREVLPLYARTIAGTRKGLQRFAHFIVNGYDPELLLADLTGEAGKGKWDLPRVDPFLRSGKPAVRRAGAVLQFGPRLLGATDVLFRSMAESGQRYAWAMRKAVQEGAPDVGKRAADLLLEQPPEMLKDAQLFARKATYMDDPSWIARGLIAMRERADTATGGGAGQFIAPFVRVSDRVAAALTDYMPGKALGALGKGAIRERLVGKEGSELVARQVAGTAVAGLALGLAAEGRLTGPLPEEPAERDRFYQQGKQPYSVRIGDGWYPMRDLLGPLAAPVIAAERLWTAAHSAEQPEGVLRDGARAVAGAALGVGRFMLDASYLEGLAGVLKALEEEAAPGGELLARQAIRWGAGHIPFSGALRTAANATDPRVVEKTSLLDPFKADIPGLRQQLPGRAGRYGEDLMRATGGVMGAVSPVAGSGVRRDPVDDELARLGLNPGFVGKKLGEQDLTPDQRREYQRLSGKKVRELLELVLASDAYRNASDAEKKKAAERTMGRARAWARGMMLQKMLARDEQRSLGE